MKHVAQSLYGLCIPKAVHVHPHDCCRSEVLLHLTSRGKLGLTELLGSIGENGDAGRQGLRWGHQGSRHSAR